MPGFVGGHAAEAKFLNQLASIMKTDVNKLKSNREFAKLWAVLKNLPRPIKLVIDRNLKDGRGRPIQGAWNARLRKQVLGD